ncbi:MAG TPA: radical SAM family heme chaperone HemW [Ktedonobacterales bacterium]|nr:radical SAM family heme chaperone HemW [Ktedonobacterales bacterium]
MLAIRQPERTSAAVEAELALLRTLSLYVHVPFCHAKCHYCDFNSYAGQLRWREPYVQALLREITWAGDLASRSGAAGRPIGQPWPCRTIFFGGGTPSLLTAEQVLQIVEAARQAFIVQAGAEITLEANPGTLEQEHLMALRAGGVNRLSMGAQSFDAGLLRWMGRIHGPEEIERAFYLARSAGFENINLDFMFGLPDQRMEQWETTLERALALAPDHLSLYALIVEEGTPLQRWVEQGRVRPADDDLTAEMYLLAQRRLAEAGYVQYEISNWAKPGKACQHNLTYWHNRPYLGVGAGAHSSFAGRRFSTALKVRDYIERVQSSGNALVESEEIGQDLEMTETAMLALRLNEGLSLALFEQRYGKPFEQVFGERLAPIEAAGLLERSDGMIRLSEQGRLLGNEVFIRLLPD